MHLHSHYPPHDRTLRKEPATECQERNRLHSISLRFPIPYHQLVDMASRSERRQNSGENDVGDVSPSPAATLTDEMRRASKDIHDTSDRLVNMKLGLVLTSPGLYGEALALFYPIFAKIEDIIELQKGHKQIGKIYPLLELMRRAPGFRKDMEYYLTSDRRAELDQMVQRGENSVMEDFLQHLDRISKEDPVLILAYIYHEYAGILAGGQIIKRIVQKALGLSKDSDDGVQCFCMSDKTIAPKINCHVADEENFE